MLDETTPVYNCIAWAMGYTDRWVGGLDPKLLSSGELPPPGYYWPDKVPYSSSPDSLVSAFKAEGFEKTKNASYEKGYDKVALYRRRKRFFCNYTWTHASRIVSDEVEHCKLGRSFNVAHSSNQFSKSILSTWLLWRKRNGRCVVNDLVDLFIDIISDVFILILDLFRSCKSASSDYGEVFTYMRKADPEEKYRKDYIELCEAQEIRMGEQ